MEDGRVRKLFSNLLRERSCPVALLNDTCVLRLVLEDSQAKANIPNGMSVPTVFEIQPYFQPVALMSREVGRKTPNMVQNEVNSRSTDMTVQLLQKVSNMLTKACLFETLQVVIQRYLWISPALIQWQVLLQRSYRFVSLKR